jgi:chemotaxis protein methyltransferase CheR
MPVTLEELEREFARARQDRSRALEALTHAGAEVDRDSEEILSFLRSVLDGSTEYSIIASDLDRTALARARGGLYHAGEVARGLSEHRLERFFSPSGQAWQVCPGVLQKVDFRHLNLVQPWPAIGRFDLILVRNVLMYLTLEARTSVLGRAAEHLAPAGRLLLGSSESLIGLDVPLKRVPEQRIATYRRAPGADAAGAEPAASRA